MHGCNQFWRTALVHAENAGLGLVHAGSMTAGGELALAVFREASSAGCEHQLGWQLARSLMLALGNSKNDTHFAVEVRADLHSAVAINASHLPGE